MTLREFLVKQQNAGSVGDYFAIMGQSNIIKNLAEVVRYYEEKEIAIKELTGFSLDELVGLFAEGYVLKTPVYTSLSDMVEGEKI